MQEKEHFKGLIAAPFTPMDDQGNLALDKIASLARLYEHNGVAGAFICGSTGEGVSLSHTEKREVLSVWSKVKGDQLITVFMLGGNCIKEMQELAVEASENGYDAVSMLSPFYFRPSNVAQLVSFCQEVVSVVPQLPFYYYHIPALTGANFPMLEYLRQAEDQIPNLKGIKYTGPNIMDFHACQTYNDGKYDLLWGTDEALLAGLATGAKGGVGSTYNYAAPLYHQIIKAFNAGDLSIAEKLQRSAVKVVEILVKYGGIGAGKAFMKIIGMDCGWFRMPIPPVPLEKMKEMEKDLEKLGFFDFCSQIPTDQVIRN